MLIEGRAILSLRTLICRSINASRSGVACSSGSANAASAAGLVSPVARAFSVLRLLEGACFLGESRIQPLA
jgi:hypothetical protein